MTVVEFLDPSTLNNLIGCLTMRPNKVIFVGDKSMTERCREKYIRLIERFSPETELDFRNVNKRNIDDIIDALSEIIENEDDEVSFNLNGGDDLLLFAMGVVFESYRGEKHIDLHRINVSSGRVVDCDGDDDDSEYEPLHLSVEESLAIYGGRLKNYTEGKGTYQWYFDDEFLSDIAVLWGICKENPKLWNLQISTLAVIAGESSPKENELTVHAKTSYIKGLMEAGDAYYRWNTGFIKRLIKDGYLLNYREEDDFYSFSFKNEQIKKCLTKAGTILELKVYQTLNEVNRARPSKPPYFNDAVIGAFIDWDDADGADKDVENEIDVMVMKGVVPIFISCKNGKVDIDELYKLNSVAQHFGGEFSKKYLVITNYGEPQRNGDNSAEINKIEAHKALVNKRAADMGITVLENVHLLDDSDFKKTMRMIVG